MKRLIIIAFHFPPIQGSSGMYRTLGFAKYLREFGWETTVITANPRLYPAIREENLDLVFPGINVERVFGMDSKQHLSLFGKHPSILALPDRWWAWGGFAALKAIQLMKRDRPSAVLTTYPIASAHLAGLIVSSYSCLPWIADFRDPMTEPGYPADPLQRRAFLWLEKKVFQRAQRILVTTPGAARFYEEKYPDKAQGKIAVVQNGYDEDVLMPAARKKNSVVKIVILHSGIVYPRERNPRALFVAISELRREGIISAETIEVRLRASGNHDEYRYWLTELEISDIVTLPPVIGYEEAAREMAEVDALLLLQSAHCNRQIPAKAYEYLRAGRPMLALVDPAGDTGHLLAEVGVKAIARLENKNEIKDVLKSFIEQVRADDYPPIPQDVIAAHSRRAKAEELARLLKSLP